MNTVTLARLRIATPPIIRLLAALIIALAWPAAQAAPPVWYTVELIVFANLDTSSAGDERWPPDPGTPALGKAVELLDATGPEASPPELRLAYQQITGEALQLNAEWNRLRRSTAYHPLLHIAWRQPGLTRAEARAVHLRGRAATPAGDIQSVPAAPGAALSGPPAPRSPEIEGTLRLYRARYLHLDVDLRYQPGLPPPGLEQEVSAFRLTESRRVRSRKLHYFDHPLFGVLALVTPVPAPETGEPGDGQPAAAPPDAATIPVQAAPAAP